jgi:ubiquinone/menaquinone biosynthesis C-methylase UbiE
MILGHKNIKKQEEFRNIYIYIHTRYDQKKTEMSAQRLNQWKERTAATSGAE